jgi:hypothetical protein
MISNNNLLYFVVGLKSELVLENSVYPATKMIIEIDDDTKEHKVKFGNFSCQFV